MKETERYAGPDGEALHPGDRIGLEPPGCLKRDDGLDAWLTALRHEMARACELPEYGRGAASRRMSRGPAVSYSLS